MQGMRFQIDLYNFMIKLFIFTGCLMLSGCNLTPKANKQAIEYAEQGDFISAQQRIDDAYKNSSSNELLYYLESGMLAHLQHHYELSNQHLSHAKEIIEAAYTVSISDQLFSAFTGASYKKYTGRAFHKPMIHTLMALNYVSLANASKVNRVAMYDSALTEMRQLDLYLSQLQQKTGGYVNQQKAGNDIEQIFKAIFNQPFISGELEYKDDAFAQYLSGVLYEQQGELDSARIQYERAVSAYKNGFSKQYKLGQYAGQQAQQDLNRMVADKEENYFTLVQSLGVSPQRKEFNLYLRPDEEAQALVITPIYWGTKEERQAQFAWFNLMFADTSLFDLIQNYATGDFSDVVLGTVTKRLPLGDKLWQKAVDEGVIDALKYGSRISVTYLQPHKNDIQHVALFANGQKLTELHPFYSVNLLTLYDALGNANMEIYTAISREVLKAVTASKAIKQVGIQQNSLLAGLAQLTSSVTNAITAAADTRQWQSLPGEIRVARVKLPENTTHLQLQTQLRTGRVIKQDIPLTQTAPLLSHIRTFTGVAEPEKQNYLSSLTNMD
ncbi:hypothetical protein [Pseudoalteromonas sp. Of11M-6]|uniref:hypothetical protein n=1 Tax=Pseudoalteromonas sp. Of11M-6 TaxID=2917754 RepID=UPI001EF4E4AD|nr:hypothetical protein [Pseudoalteromonas sp. Of11M-6]MCG7555669.1 hypothetical protein [Pseudoalteromonas sp. Of11M-6]